MRGASTITQQLAKNLYLSPTRNPFRKLTELLITRRLEHELSKTRIFELYLNNIEWGDGIWGAEAAAQTYFGIPASAIGPDQAAHHGGRDHQSTRAEHREAQRAPSRTPADHPRAHGQDYAAAGGREAGAGRSARGLSRPKTNPKKNRRLSPSTRLRHQNWNRNQNRIQNRNRNPEPGTRTRNPNPELASGTRNPKR